MWWRWRWRWRRRWRHCPLVGNKKKTKEKVDGEGGTVHAVVRGNGRTYVQTVYVEDILYPTWLYSQLYTQDYLPGTIVII